MPRSDRATWWMRFAILFALCELWAIGAPLFSGPDEPSHVIKAASVVRGELLPDRVDGTRYQFVDVPQRLDSGNAAASCTAFHPEQDASCIDYRGNDDEVAAPTLVGRYPPLPYAVLGLPTLVTTGVAAIYVMRTLVAVATAACVACALGDLDFVGGPIARVAAFVALTPMALFLSGTVNPNAVEIAAAMLVWTSALRLASEAGEGVPSPRSIRRAGIAALVLALCRLLGPLWLVVIGTAVAIGFVPRDAMRRLARSTSARVWVAVVALASMGQTLWVLLADPVYGDDASATTWSTSRAARESIGRLSAQLREAIGVFGWLDTPAPTLTWVLWIAVVGAIVITAACVVTRRERIALALLLAAVVVVPFGFELARARELGISWQGRYSLPVAVGIPILGTATLSRRVALPPAVRLSATRIVVGSLAIAHFVAYWQFLRRYSVGANGPVMFFLHPHWDPPLPLALLLVGYALALGAFAWTVGAFSSAREPSPPTAPSARTTGSLSSGARSG